MRNVYRKRRAKIGCWELPGSMSEILAEDQSDQIKQQADALAVLSFDSGNQVAWR